MYENRSNKWTLTPRGVTALVADVRNLNPDGVAGWKPVADNTGSFEWCRRGASLYATPGWDGDDSISVVLSVGGGVPDTCLTTIDNDGNELTAEYYVHLMQPILAGLAALIQRVEPEPPKVSAAFLEALDRMIAAAHDVYDAWPAAGVCTGAYPKGQPSFDEHVSALMAWRASLGSAS